jgi:Fe-S cluster biosynthesis and repair protein YggX
MIINENGLTTADPQSTELIEKHMLGFFFGEGDYGQLPAEFRQAGGGKK